MAITVTILNSSIDPVTGRQTARVVIDDGVGHLYPWSVGGIDPLANLQATLNNMAAQLLAEASQAAPLPSGSTNTPLWQVDCTVVGARPLTLIQGSQKIFLPWGLQIGLAAVAGLVTPPTLSVGTNAPNYDDIIPSTVSPVTVAKHLRNVAVGVGADTIAIDTDLWIYLNVRVAATAAVYTVAAMPFGTYLAR